MRAGLIYAFFVILTLLIVSSDRTEREQTKGDTLNGQSINVNNNYDCIIPEASFCLDRNFSELNLFRLIHTKFFVNAYHRIFKISTTILKLYLAKDTGLKPIRQKPIRLKSHYTSKKKDSYHLAY